MEREADLETIERVERFRERSHIEPTTAAILNRLNEHVSQNGKSPGEYLAESLRSHDVVMIGELIPTAQSCGLLVDLIPVLAENGVWHFCTDWLLFDDQLALDELVNASEFNELMAVKLVMRGGAPRVNMPVDRVEVLRAVWNVNQHRDRLAPSMRIIGLDYEIAYDNVTDRADLLTPEAWPHLRDRGSAARFMADILERFVSGPRHRAVVSCSTTNALTLHRRDAHPTFDRIDRETTDGVIIGAGNLLYGSKADRVATVLVHQPMLGPIEGSPEYVFAGDGMIDLVFARFDGPKYPVGFDVVGSPFASLRTDSSYDSAPLGRLAHGWIYLDPLHKLTGPEQLTDRVSVDNVDDLRRRMVPGDLRQPDNGVQQLVTALETNRLVSEMTWNAVGT
ncbi:MAG: hypothetical protein GY708_01980 [Actinomycetia bacterium]|nr:hypothetical protein [Actinomycetes bacterium]MCP4961014.1 hypothetical protein [Actinomycetes bacterium]